jgi:hypothetical protein
MTLGCVIRGLTPPARRCNHRLNLAASGKDAQYQNSRVWLVWVVRNSSQNRSCLTGRDETVNTIARKNANSPPTAMMAMRGLSLLIRSNALDSPHSVSAQFPEPVGRSRPPF